MCEIEKEAKVIANKLELGDQIFKTSKINANITLKDHKSTFSHNPTCRLLNPTKPEMGKVSKKILSAHIWELKDKGIPHKLDWSILATASGYNPSTKQCRLCLLECWYILFQEEKATLNKRLEIFTNCRHKARLTLEPKAIKDD